MQTKTNLARVNGIELGYQEFGTGKPLILLHGGFGSLAILPGLTHYDINLAPVLSATVIPFLDGA